MKFIPFWDQIPPQNTPLLFAGTPAPGYGTRLVFVPGKLEDGIVYLAIGYPWMESLTHYSTEIRQGDIVNGLSRLEDQYHLNKYPPKVPIRYMSGKGPHPEETIEFTVTKREQ